MRISPSRNDSLSKSISQSVGLPNSNARVRHRERSEPVLPADLLRRFYFIRPRGFLNANCSKPAPRIIYALSPLNSLGQAFPENANAGQLCAANARASSVRWMLLVSNFCCSASPRKLREVESSELKVRIQQLVNSPIYNVPQAVPLAFLCWHCCLQILSPHCWLLSK